MWYIKIGRRAKADTEAKRANQDLRHDELMCVFGGIHDALQGINDSLAALAEDSYKRRIQ